MITKNSASPDDGLDAGSRLELQIDSIAHGGVCVARHDGRVVFVTDTIPGERVIAQISEAKNKSFLRADAIEVLEPSEFRQDHIWPEAGIERDPALRAGGAEFGHIALAHQRHLKSEVISDALQRFGKVSRQVSVEAMPGDDDTTGTRWRTRVRLHVDEAGQVGPYAAKSHTVIPVSSLPLATVALEEIAPLDQRIPGIDFLDLIAPSTGRARSIAGTYQGRPERETITEMVGTREFKLDMSGFWQVHHQAAGVLSTAVATMIDDGLFDPKAANHDLYGGVGLFAAAMADRFGSTTRMTVVESDEVATEYAAENLSEWVGARALSSRVDRYLSQLTKNMTAVEHSKWKQAAVIMDPPRQGAGKETINHLAQLSPAQIVYVACDPVALARDVAYLAEAGYELGDIRAFDLFPNTHHMEAVAHFVRAS